ncbi:DUF4202 domain-containing protein [Acuticoccus sp. I52.16.1]|uniref:DUF4202 domain-containing protein n=1 Tax=Acuticoccus sp. I52.16.1 TaxID=2928472 RepID=UPI001FD3E701|nr:DUF4202 domain-containing protein [Acuticoccus sp. I52.16.1]UOM35467.1 DUF4202 domain-containing protein [Acuticoccus sp. I52.16.1]
MSERFERVIAAIDAANAADPNLDQATGRPAEVLYGERMSEELARLAPDAPEAVKIAARGQHIERWKSPRESYPEGRAGYLAWRTDLGRFHAERVAELMADAGYGEAERAAVSSLLRKEGIKRNPDTQLLEDTICFVFVRHYFAAFAAKHQDDDVMRILTKTARKMSPEARARMAAEFDLPPHLAPALA